MAYFHATFVTTQNQRFPVSMCWSTQSMLAANSNLSATAPPPLRLAINTSRNRLLVFDPTEPEGNLVAKMVIDRQNPQQQVTLFTLLPFSEFEFGDAIEFNLVQNDEDNTYTVSLTDASGALYELACDTIVNCGVKYPLVFVPSGTVFGDRFIQGALELELIEPDTPTTGNGDNSLGSGWITLIVLLVIAVLAFAGVIMWRYFGSGTKGSPTSEMLTDPSLSSSSIPLASYVSSSSSSDNGWGGEKAIEQFSETATSSNPFD
jgi:hypothetical protein